MLSFGHILGALLTLALFGIVAWISQASVKSFEDFATGRNSLGAIRVSGTIVGTIVGGAATIGAAQLAFSYGVVGWWFSLGSGLALGFLALFLAGPVRKTGSKTIVGLLTKTYGDAVSLWSWLFTTAGLFLNIIGQTLAATSLLSTVFSLKPFVASFLTLVAVFAYVVYGGVYSAGSVGVVKTFLLIGSMLTVGGYASSLAGGIGHIGANVPDPTFLNLFARGFATDLAAAFSLVVGVCSTQTYLQALFSAKDDRSAKSGAIIAAFISAFVGLPGVLIGLFMRVYHPGIAAATALPRFVTLYVHPVVAGVILATLFVSIIGTAAGLSLGAGVMFAQDVFLKRLRPNADDKAVLLASRLAIALFAIFALLAASGGGDSLILKWSFLSMGLRGSTVFFPLLAAVFCPRFVSPKAGVCAVALAPLASIIWGVLFPAGMDPLYVGLSVSAGVIGLGSFGRHLKKRVHPGSAQRTG